MGIKQFSGRYLQDQDRLLFRLNTTDDKEFRFLLTRRITRELLGGGRRQLASLITLREPGAVGNAVVRFKQEALRQSADLGQTFAPAAERPLGAQPVLVLEASHKVDLKVAPPRALLSLKLPNNQDAVFHLPLESLERMQLLLDQLQQRASWDLGREADNLSLSMNAQHSEGLH